MSTIPSIPTTLILFFLQCRIYVIISNTAEPDCVFVYVVCRFNLLGRFRLQTKRDKITRALRASVLLFRDYIVIILLINLRTSVVGRRKILKCKQHRGPCVIKLVDIIIKI